MRIETLADRLRSLRRAPRVRAGVREKYAALSRLTAANNAALELVADLQRSATGEFVFDANYLRTASDRALAYGREVVEALDILSDGRERRLGALLERLSAEIGNVLRDDRSIPEGPYVLDFSRMKGVPADLLGAKVRRLAEIRLDVGVPVPDGFAVTSAACHALLVQSGLWASIQATIRSLTLIDKARLARASGDIRARILDTPWPRAVAAAVLEAYDGLVARAGRESPLVSVRSSAADEDGEFSFAGQYVSVLNVDRSRLLQACSEVVASQFGPRAVVYYKSRGLESAHHPMAIGIVLMIDALASGVLYTRSPERPGEQTMLITGTWGLGPSTADGTVSPDVIRVSARPGHDIVSSTIALKPRMLLTREGGGVIEVDVPGWMREQPCLTRAQVGMLAAYGSRLERHYGGPQDVEWAVDRAERVLVLQSRPLRTEEPRASAPLHELRKGLPLLLSGGIIASTGVAAGPVSVVDDTGPFDVPAGAVVVSRAAVPALAEVADRASAFVTEVGSVACHLATVAREFRIPTIVNADGARAALRPGQVVTVDAEMGHVYEGRIDALLALTGARQPDRAMLQSPLFRRLGSVLSLLAPLHLTDPRSRDFKASGCQTLHDLLRYAHERAVQEMFVAGGEVAELGASVKLASDLPLDFFLVDLGGGLAGAGDEDTVTPEAFRCRPLRAIWAGLVAAPWAGGPAVGLASLGSLLVTGLSRREPAGGPEANYVLVTDSYVNISFRFGFHFARIDASLSQDFRTNYASVVFHGGAAGAGGRERRLDFIAGVLASRPWTVSRRGDALFGRADNLPDAELSKELETLGRLLVVTRQLDTRLADDEATARAVAAFGAGDDSLGLDVTDA
ncbi:MAG: PEP/pyruvate-binding domain-containing protein [Acidobacteriota bacterium]